MKEDCIYFIGIALYLLVLAVCMILFRKKNITSLRFLLLSALFLLMLNIIYWVAIRMFTNSYEGWGNTDANLWQKGGELYYFDTHGRSQYGFLSEKAKEGEIITGVYCVANHDALQTAIQHDSQLSDSEVEQLIDDGVFITAENDVLLSVTTKIKDDTSRFVFWVLAFGVAIAALVMYYLRFSKK